MRNLLTTSGLLLWVNICLGASSVSSPPTSATTLNQVISTSVSEALDDAIVASDSGAFWSFNLDKPASFAEGLRGVDQYIPMVPMLFGTAVTNWTIAGYQTVLSTLGTMPHGCFIMTNTYNVSSNFVDFICGLPPGQLKTNDPVLSFMVWEGRNESGTLTNSILTLSWLVSSNGFRIDNATKIEYGTVTNDHKTAGPGARYYRQDVTLAGAGSWFTNTLNNTFVVRIARGTDDFTNTIGILPEVKLGVRR